MKIRTSIILVLALIAGFSLGFGCGAAVTIVEEVDEIEPPPSDIRTVGVLSGAEYSTGGEHYKVVHTLGAPFAETIQTSENGRYQVK